MLLNVCFSCFKTKKVHNDQKFCNRNYFNQLEKKKQISYKTNIATDLMLTGDLDDQ